MPLRFSKHRILSLLFLSAVTGVPMGCNVHGAFWQLWRSDPREDTQKAPSAKGENVKIRFKGNTAFSESQLRSSIEEQLSRIRSEGLSRPNADDAAYYVAAYYHQYGYDSAEVLWQIEGGHLLLSINEGIKTRLGSTSIQGNLSLPSTKLLSLLTSVTTDRLKSPESAIPFVRDEIKMGASRILDLYLSEGFLEVKIDPPEFDFSPDNTSASVRISVNEGKQYRFGTVKFRGLPIYSQEELMRAIQPILEKPYNAPRVMAVQNGLHKFYAEKAHYEASVEVSEAPASEDGKVPLTVFVQPGPCYRFQGVETDGLVRLRESWLRHRLASLEGRPFSPDLLERKQQELLASGLFESLKITPLPQSDQTLRLRVDVREPAYREVSLSLGYGSYEGAMAGVRIANRNLLGKGILGSVELNLSQRALALETAVSDPWLFETRTEFVTRAFIRTRAELGYDKRDAGLKGELSRRLFDPLRAAVFAQVRAVEITNFSIPVVYVGSTAYQVATFGASMTFDKRDNILNPSTGWIASLLADSNTLSNGATFTRTSGRLGWHYPLPGRIRFGASARVGLLSRRSEPPIDERYFLGGSTTVRSFQERELGAGNASIPTGGSAYSLLNAETDFPLWQKLRGALFYDAGSLSPRGGEVPTSDFRSAVGVGVRYALPFGPVRFDVGLNPDRRPNEQWGAAHLSFGFAF